MMFWLMLIFPLYVFAGTIECKKEFSIPFFIDQTPLTSYVNEQLKEISENVFLNTSNTCDEECLFSYVIQPTYQSANLISLFGTKTQLLGCRGCSYYEGLNFWQNGDTILLLSLNDLFISRSGYLSYLLQYCRYYFNAPLLEEEDLQTFVLMDAGIKIIFRAYRIDGWADGPTTVLIDYEALKKFVDMQGPLSEFFTNN